MVDVVNKLCSNCKSKIKCIFFKMSCLFFLILVLNNNNILFIFLFSPKFLSIIFSNKNILVFFNLICNETRKILLKFNF